MMKSILNEMNLENGSNYKLDVMRKHKESVLFQNVLRLALDGNVKFGITMTSVKKMTPVVEGSPTLGYALEKLEDNLVKGNVTGNAAAQLVANLIASLNEDDADVLTRVIRRDLKVGASSTSANKVWKDLISKTPYMRCDTFGPKSAKKITFPAIVQLKADGTYREVSVDAGEVTFTTRSGKTAEYPKLAETFKNLPDGRYIGEMLVEGIVDRSEGNGLINSKTPPHDLIQIDLWDFITHKEWANAKGKNETEYKDRLEALIANLASTTATNVKVIDGKIVNNVKEAMQFTSEMMNKGLEGGVLKNLTGPTSVFKSGTSKGQLKMKLQIDVEVRITGFTESDKREFGAIMFENDEGTIKGQCSGIKEKVMLEMDANREDYIGKVMTVQFNDLVKGRGNDYYALSHPRFIEVRDDKDETDTLEKAFKLREMAMELS